MQVSIRDEDKNSRIFLQIFSIFPDLDIRRYGLLANDKVRFEGIINVSKEEGTIGEAVDFLQKVYGETVAAEFLYLEVSKTVAAMPYLFLCRVATLC